MSHRLKLLLAFLFLLSALGIRAETNIYSFTANDGTFYHRIKITRVDDEGVFYAFTEGAGGGRLKFSQLPDYLVDEVKSLKPREKTFADSLPANDTNSGPAAEAASSNRTGKGEKSDSATLALSNKATRALCTFSRTVSTNGIDYRIALTYYGTNYLGLGSADSLMFDADGTLVTYSPVPGTHRVEANASQMSETQVYNTSLRDLQKICEAQKLGVELNGPLGNDDFAVPSASILKNFGRYCLTNAAAAASRRNSGFNTGGAAVSAQSTAQNSAQQPAEVLEATAKLTDTDSYTSQWAWKVTLRAPALPPKDFLMEIQFLDADGYVLAHEVEYPVKLAAGETNTLTGQSAIKTALSARVKTCKVVMK
jgi:hypothetical protein